VEVEAVEVPAAAPPVGVEKAFRPYDPDQVLLMAPVLREWVPDGDLAHFVSDLVDSGALDLSAIYAGYIEERGFPPYDPRLMVKLLVYGYANGVTSSRKLERATYRDVAVRMLCADQHPTTARSLDSVSGTCRRWGSCSCRRCGCAGRAGWLAWECSPWMAPSCARTPRATRR
jgi:transposase